MALNEQTVEYAFDTGTSNVSTNTTLGTATTYTSGTITLTLPETVSRTIKCVMLEIGWRDNGATAYGAKQFRAGIKLGAVAVTTFDRMNGEVGAWGNNTHRGVVDVTSYFVSNFGAGATQTAQFTLAVAHTTASTINMITGKLIITYQFSDLTSDNATRAKTVRIPIQSNTGLLTASQVEVGTSGTTAAPANQIPQLSTFLPEASATIKQAWLEVLIDDANPNGTSTAFGIAYQIDSATAITRPSLVNTADSQGHPLKDIVIYDTATYSTSSAHALKMASSLTNRYNLAGAILHVTYTYDEASTTTVLNEGIYAARLRPQQYIESSTNGTDAVTVEVWVEEPDTIAIKQSAIVFRYAQDEGGTNIPFAVSAGSQSARSYTTVANDAHNGTVEFIHRVDHSSGWTLTRGLNLLTFSVSANVAAGTGGLTAQVILNYTSGKSAQGTAYHKKVTRWYIGGVGNPSTENYASNWEWFTLDSTKNPVITPPYLLESVCPQFQSAAQNTGGLSVHVKHGSGEYDDTGWRELFAAFFRGQSSNAGDNWMWGPEIAGFFNRYSPLTGKLDITLSTRKWHGTKLGSAYLGLDLYVTYSALTFSISGAGVSRAISNSNGGTVSIRAFRSDTHELVGTTSRVGDGDYDFSWFDSTIPLYFDAYEDSTHLGRSALVTLG